MHIVEYSHKNQTFKERMVGTETDIRNKLFKENKTVIAIKKENILLRRRVKKDEIIIFFTALGDMLASKQKMSDAISIIIRSIKRDSAIIPILSNIHESICKGKHLSKCLEPHANVFGVTTVSMIEAGENAGKLAETLRTVVKHEEIMESVKRNVVKQLIGPCFTLIVGILGFISTTQFLIPQLVSIQKKIGSGKVDNNIYITILTSLSWLTPIFVCIIIAFLVYVFAYYKNNQEKAERTIIKIPVVNALLFYRSYYVAFSGLSNMLSVGVRLQQALPIISKSAKVIIIKKEFEEASLLINKGKLFANAFNNISDIERTSLTTAQKEDRLESVMGVIADRFYRLYINKIETVSPKIKYVVYALIVFLILLIFFGIYTPYLTMMETMK